MLVAGLSFMTRTSVISVSVILPTILLSADWTEFTATTP